MWSSSIREAEAVRERADPNPADLEVVGNAGNGSAGSRSTDDRIDRSVGSGQGGQTDPATALLVPSDRRVSTAKPIGEPLSYGDPLLPG